jgi:hypothetical protein
MGQESTYTRIRLHSSLANPHPSFMQIRSISIDDTMNALDPISPLPSTIISRRLDIPPLPADTSATVLIEGISVCGNGLVATVAIIVPDQEITSRIVIADVDIGPARWMLTGPDQPIPLPQARLHNQRMFVFGYRLQDFVVRIYELPTWLSTKHCDRTASKKLDVSSLHGAEGGDVAWGALLAEYSRSLGNNLMDTVHIPSVSIDFLTIMVFNESDPSQPSARVIRFPLHGGTSYSKPEVTSTRVPLPLDTSIRSVCIGTSGRRAVWMEHNLDTTRTRLMKLELGGTHDRSPELFHGVLLPPDLPLPFLTDACHSLAFDEAICRLCLGLWDGRLRVVDFS